MASIATRPNGHRWLSFKAPNGKRQTLRLGNVTLPQAETFKAHVERLLAFERLGEVPDGGTIEWLSRLGDGLHSKLVNAGAVAPRGARTVGELVEWFLSHRQAKPSTLVNLRNCASVLVRYLGKERRLIEVTPELAHSFRRWLELSGGSSGKPLAPTTVSSICRRCRGMFQAAVERRWILTNPFRELKNWVNTNPDRDEYISRPVANQVLDEIGCPEMRLLFVLVRYAGLRSPSEPLELEWPWVNWQHQTLFVKAPKTERYEGQESRIVPLDRPVVECLQVLWDKAPEGATKIFDRLQVTRAAIAGRLETACRRAGLVMWAKPFVNLRASCEHDWLETRTINEVAAWMGHSPETMLRHYNRVAKEQQARHGARALHLENAPNLFAKPEAPPSVAAVAGGT